ncbi:MAG: hypothetical protein FWH29_04875 [Methanobrevibacter sp.]|nr:hypothetical protein [Methanobrevibacter sp.]
MFFIKELFDESDVLTILKDINKDKHINIVETNHFLLGQTENIVVTN